MNGLNTYFSYVAFLSLTLLSGVLNANPEGGTVVNGSATFNQQGTTLTVTNTPGTIINWQDFSIQSDETTRFIQQSSDSSVLNRVVGQDPSQILGKLQSNGRVFIINPNGISFGANSVVDVSGLAASSLNLSNEDFLSQQFNFSGDGTNGNIINEGSITTSEGGFIYLIAPNVENHGVITSPKGEVILAAGHSVQLVNSDDPDIRVTVTAPDGEALNVGEIITRGGKTSIYAGIINQQGKVNADSAIIGENGKIFFKATSKTILTSTSSTSANGVDGGNIQIETINGLTEVSGEVSATGSGGKGGTVLVLGNHVGIIDNATIDTSGTTGGGTILIGGSWQNSDTSIKQSTRTIVEEGATLKANALENGNGGTIVAWSDITDHSSETFAHGTFEVKGGDNNGNGGRIETSGAYLNVAGINISATATNGSGGEWLLDPDNIIIDAAGPTTTGASALPNYLSSVASSTIWNGDIVSQLNAGTSVTIQTGASGGLNGDITVNAPITKTAGGAATLTLKAHSNIITNSSISSTVGALNIDLQADQPVDGVGSVTLNSTLNSLGGNISITSAGDVTLNSGINTINAGTGTVTLTSTTGWIHGDPAGAPTDIIAGSVTLNGTNGIFANSGSAQFTVSTPTLSFSNSGTGLVRIHNSFVGATSVTGSNNSGDIIIQNTDSTNALTVGNITASNGLISLNSDIIDIVGSVNAGANTVYLKNFVNNAAISVGGSALFDINSTELANISAGNIQIGRDTFGNYAGAATIASAAAVTMGGKNVWITAKNGISVSANNVNNTGGQLYLDNITSGNITTGSGVITSDYVQFRSIGNINIGSGGINSTAAGSVYLLGADVNIAGPINAGTNDVFLAPYLTNTAISIGGSQTFDLTSTDLNNITAGSIVIGESLASVVYASTVDVATTTAVSSGTQTLRVTGNNNMTFGANTFTATGADVTFKSATGNVTTGTGLLSSDILVLEGAGLITVGSGGITTTNYAGLNGGNAIINGTMTSPIVYLSVFTPGSTISIGGSQPFNIIQPDIDNINAGLLQIGNNPYVANTSTINMATAVPIDFGARNVVFESTNGMLFGGNAFKATGGNLTFNNTNTGFDITTGTGMISANNVTLNSARDIILNNGGISAAASIVLNATNAISQGGNLVATGAGGISLTATNQAITMAAGTTTIGTNQLISYNAGTDITLATLGSGSANTTLNAGGNIIDSNGNGVVNVTANNLTVSSGGNSSLDYQITGTLNSTGVVGIADLRVYPTSTGTTTTTSVNEPLTTTVSTIANTTNSLSTDTTSSGTTTLALADTTTSDNPTESSTTTDTTSTQTTPTDETTTKEESSEDSQTTSSVANKQPKQIAKNLPICK